MRTALALALLSACSGAMYAPGLPPPVRLVERIVPCMEPPPALFVPEWPTPDRLGNMLIHTSTVDGLKNALAEQRRYIDEQYFRCRDRADDIELWHQR
jgi:hypothetical protein